MYDYEGIGMAHLTGLKRAVRRLVKAELDDAWSGAGYPEDIDACHRELKKARGAYQEALKKLAREIGERIARS